MEAERIKPDTAIYQLDPSVKVAIIDNEDSTFNFYICGHPADKQDSLGTIFMFDDEMLIKLRKLIDEYIGN